MSKDATDDSDLGDAHEDLGDGFDDDVAEQPLASAVTDSETDSELEEPEDSGGFEDHDDDQDSGDDAAGDVPRFARLAGWLGFLLPPVGAVMGHLWLAWEGKDKDVPGRRHAVTAVIVGWFLTFVLTIAALIGTTLWYEAREAERILEAREQITAQELDELLEAAQDSPSTGVIDAATCDQVFAMITPETVPEDLDDWIASFEDIAAGATPHAQVYRSHAEYLSGFDSFEEIAELDEVERGEQADPLMGALNDDSLGCVALDENYFLDNVANRNTMEF